MLHHSASGAQPIYCWTVISAFSTDVLRTALSDFVCLNRAQFVSGLHVKKKVQRYVTGEHELRDKETNQILWVSARLKGLLGKSPPHRNFTLWVWRNDTSDGCSWQLCQHFPSPRPQPPTTSRLPLLLPVTDLGPWWYTSVIHYYTLTLIVFGWKWLRWPFYGKWK